MSQVLSDISFAAKNIKSYGPTQEAANRFMSSLENIYSLANVFGHETTVDDLIKIVSAEEDARIWNEVKLLDNANTTVLTAIAMVYLGLLTENLGVPVNKSIIPIIERGKRELKNHPDTASCFEMAYTMSLWMLGESQMTAIVKKTMAKEGYSEDKQYAQDMMIEFVMVIAQTH